MIACEKCGVWQHIKCLQKSGQLETRKNMEEVAFVCRPCENQIVDIVDDEEEKDLRQQKRMKMSHHYQPQHLPPQLHYPSTNLFSQQPTMFPPPQMQQMQQQQQTYPTAFAAQQHIQQWQQQQQQQQQPSQPQRAPFYPVTQPMKPPSLSSIHNLINNITPPQSSRGSSTTPSSMIVEPPTPPSLRQQFTPTPTPQQQVPISKLTAPVDNYRGVHPAPNTPTQPQPQQPFILQQTAQAPMSTVRQPFAAPSLLPAANAPPFTHNHQHQQ